MENTSKISMAKLCPFPLNHQHEEELPSCAVSKHWPRLPTEAAQSPSLEMLRIHLDTIPSNVLWGTLLYQMSSSGLFQAELFWNSVIWML